MSTSAPPGNTTPLTPLRKAYEAGAQWRAEYAEPGETRELPKEVAALVLKCYRDGLDGRPFLESVDDIKAELRVIHSQEEKQKQR